MRRPGIIRKTDTGYRGFCGRQAAAAPVFVTFLPRPTPSGPLVVTDGERLRQIRHERRPNSTYATLANCEYEVREAEAMMRRENIPFLDATSKSVEELATTIMLEAKLVRRIY